MTVGEGGGGGGAGTFVKGTLHITTVQAPGTSKENVQEGPKSHDNLPLTTRGRE